MVTSSIQRSHSISGMTCGHCVLSVREEVGEIAGVSTVDVDLGSGRLTVIGAGFNDDSMGGALAEAGYEVVA